ncbi:MAG: hypothetical protein QOE70_432 [Chthoniobacter sp.]|jgi:HD-like signal output (HDOD) protein|nr:hypothetical protein [Chthoniobacter sp.]
MKKRILFVDDEPLVLQGLERLLRSMRDQWEMEFVESGAQALERFRRVTFDVVVSDMMMPGMNGVQLLQQVRSASPQTIRLALSGHSDQQLAIQCVGVAHQFLSKPCPAESLRSTLARVTGLGFAERSEKLLSLGRLERLPSPPAIHSQLVALLDDPGSSLEKIGALMEGDVALTAHLLKSVNSSFFGLGRRVNKLADAVSFLGLETLKALVMTAGLFEQGSLDAAGGYCAAAAAERGQMVGAAARVIAETESASRELAHECFLAGLLHDVGKLILACNLPGPFALLATADREGRPADETEIFGTTHAEIGSYLLGLWGLPPALVEAIRWHHAPAESAAREFSALTAVHVADHLVPRSPLDHRPSREVLDGAYLAALGLEDRLPVWRDAVGKLFPSTPPAHCCP